MLRERKTLTYSRVGSPFPKMAGDLMLEGRVHSVFDHSVNLEISEFGGKLLTLFTASDNTFPGSLYIEELPVEDFRTDDPVLIREKCLIVGKNILIPSERLCEVDLKLKAVNVVKADTDSKRKDHVSALSEMLKKTAGETRQAKLTGNDTETMIYSLLEERVDNLLTDPADPEKIRSLIGLGFGLTPSGDDMLLGIMTVMTAMEHPLLSSLSEAVRNLAKGTTDVSRSYLLYASEGYFSGAVNKVLSALCNGKDEGVRKAADRLLSFGHLSGSDILYGIACALSRMT